VFEAVIGAYCLDAGLDAVREFLEPLFATTAEQILVDDRQIDAKSLFQEWAQANLRKTPRYTVTTIEGPDHSRTYTVEVVVDGVSYGTGSGSSKQTAEQAAARTALKQAGVS
jgi:ribonuclease-3